MALDTVFQTFSKNISSIDKERPNIISSEDKNTAKNESDKIVAVDYVQKLQTVKTRQPYFLIKSTD